MILGKGTAQTDEAIIAEYRHFMTAHSPLQNATYLKEHIATPAVMCQRIGKPITAWKDEDILTLLQDRAQAATVRYKGFLVFLFFRGYYRPSITFLDTLKVDLGRHWPDFVQPYREKIHQTAKELGYGLEKAWKQEGSGKVITPFLWLLVVTGKPLDELTRDDFDAFEEAYQRWYRQAKSKHGKSDDRLSRLERYLVHLGILPPSKTEFRHGQYLAPLSHAVIHDALLQYLHWCEMKYKRSTVNSARVALLTFGLWLQDSFPKVGRLDEISREIALSYGQYLHKQLEAGRCGYHYLRVHHTYVRLLFDFSIDEQLLTSPARNPFSARDLPPKPDMLPRYLSDQELRQLLSYCEQGASLLDQTVIITLLHTGIRAMEFSHLKASDIVQIGNIWKLHIHEGKGLKDRLIPLTPQCLAVLQAWQEKGWEHINDFLFTRHGQCWETSGGVARVIRRIGRHLGIKDLSAHRFRHSFAVALLNYGIRESALQKLMGHARLDMTLKYGRILDQTVERAFTDAIEQMQDGAHSWVPNFFAQEDYTLFVEGDAVSWIRLPMGYCRRNVKLHCESDVKCLLCDRFAIGKEDLPRLQQMHERFTKLGLKMKADVVATQIQRLELPSGEAPSSFIPASAISAARKR